MKNTTDKTFSALPPVTLTLDPLTGLLSRNSFLEQVRIRLDQDAPKDWCIATIDLEHFKLFNDLVWTGGRRSASEKHCRLSQTYSGLLSLHRWLFRK